MLDETQRAVAGVAVKTAATVRPSDFRGLRKLGNIIGVVSLPELSYTTRIPQRTGGTVCTPD